MVSSTQIDAVQAHNRAEDYMIAPAATGAVLLPRTPQAIRRQGPIERTINVLLSHSRPVGYGRLRMAVDSTAAQLDFALILLENATVIERTRKGFFRLSTDARRGLTR